MYTSMVNPAAINPPSGGPCQADIPTKKNIAMKANGETSTHAPKKAQATPAPAAIDFCSRLERRNQEIMQGAKKKPVPRRKTHVGAEGRPWWRSCWSATEPAEKRKNTQAVTNAAMIAVRRLDVREARVGAFGFGAVVLPGLVIFGRRMPPGERYAPSLKPHARTLPALFQFQQHLPCNFFQRLEDAVTLEGDGFHHRLVFTLQFFR
jgi:hypothetical protein